MTDQALPPLHHHETLRPESPAIVLRRPCAVTGRPLAAGEIVVICERAPGQDPISTEGWVTVANCPHCGEVTRPAPAYVGLVGRPSVAPSSAGAEAEDWTPPPSRTRLSPVLTGVLTAIGVMAVCALAFAALTFNRRTSGPPPVAEVTQTAPPTTVATVPAVPSATAPLPVTPTAALPSPTVVTPTPETPTVTPTPEPTATPNPSPLTALVLMDAQSDQPIRNLHEEDTIVLSALDTTRLNLLVAYSADNIHSVRFQLDEQDFCPRENCVESTAPFAMGGDANGDYYDDWDWTALVGRHLFTAIGCTGGRGNGNCSTIAEARLNIVP